MTQPVVCVSDVCFAQSQFTGKERDSESGNDYFGARYYNPITGRFMSRDPENGKFTDPKSLHKYLYAGGDPINGFDPTGLATMTKPAGGPRLDSGAPYLEEMWEDSSLVRLLYGRADT